jgi:DNA-binding transcriptional MocR family regulator
VSFPAPEIEVKIHNSRGSGRGSAKTRQPQPGGPLWSLGPVIAHAAARGGGVYGISEFFLIRPSRTGFKLGYLRMNEKEIGEGIRRLGEIL